MTTFAQLQLTRPIIQAPMAGGASSPQLVAAVSNAGGLGSFACGMISPQQMREGVSQIRSLTSKPFAMNLFVYHIYRIKNLQYNIYIYLFRLLMYT